RAGRQRSVSDASRKRIIGEQSFALVPVMLLQEATKSGPRRARGLFLCFAARATLSSCAGTKEVHMTASSDDLDRRDALKLIAGGLGLAALGGTAACAPTMRAASAAPRPQAGLAPERFFAAPPMDTVRIGFVGVGGQGSAHVRNLLHIEGCVIKAVDDIVPEKVTHIQDLVEQAGFPRPAGYSRSPTDFVRMCGRMEMMVFNMVRQGLFGEILHAEGGYLHDLRSVKFSPEGEGLWRRAHSMQRNGNLYPTHGLGPVANCMDINRGDRFASLVS